MTAPRQVIAGRTYLISRRCTQRQYLLRPSRRVDQIYLYCLGEAAQRFGVTLHAWLAMSNHQHLVVRDNRGNFPDFLAHLHKMLAKALNAHWRRTENFWSTEQPNAVYLVEASDRFDKLVYVLANPVHAQLVERATDWPGATSLRFNLFDRTLRVKRPPGFFRAGGPMPAEVTLRAERLDGYEGATPEEWRGKLLAAIAAAEASARIERIRTNRRVVGRRNVLRLSTEARPGPPPPRRGLRPAVACKDEQRRHDELALIHAFRAAYRRARLSWARGDRDVVFPFGTYRLLRQPIRSETSGASAALSLSSPGLPQLV
jgi:REP element-mobilizing transposase RayT